MFVVELLRWQSGSKTSVHDVGGAGDKRGVVAGEKDCNLCYFAGPPDPPQSVQLSCFGPGLVRVCLTLEISFGEPGVNISRAYAIYTDSVFSMVNCHRFC